MTLLNCDGNWQQSVNGAVFCYGTLEEVQPNISNLPLMTYEDANILLLAIGSLYASIWAFQQVRRLF